MLNFCSSPSGIGFDPAKYGTTLTGAPLHQSPYQHKFGFDQNVGICVKNLNAGQAGQFRQLI